MTAAAKRLKKPAGPPSMSASTAVADLSESFLDSSSTSKTMARMISGGSEWIVTRGFEADMIE
jgi:hypothetical protein